MALAMVAIAIISISTSKTNQCLKLKYTLGRPGTITAMLEFCTRAKSYLMVMLADKDKVWKLCLPYSPNLD